MDNMELLIMLLPVLVLQLTLMIVALVHVLRHDNFKVGNKVMWVFIIIFINVLGPILYFAIGKGD